MSLLMTNKASLTTSDIENYLEEYIAHRVPELNRLWSYYQVKNETIMKRPKHDPDNTTVIGYGRKIVNTYVGYAFKDGNIEIKDTKASPDNYFEEINNIYKANREGSKTNHLGRDTAIFGEAYELHYVKPTYVDGVLVNQPRFFCVDPREMIVIYDTEPEPELKFAIHFTKQPNKDDKEVYRVELYTNAIVETYIRTIDNNATVTYTLESSIPHFYKLVPVVDFYMGSDSCGLIDPITTLIDDYDLLVSDSMIEFKRFANAYLRLVGMSFGDPTGQNPKLLRQMMDNLRYRRIFDRLRNKDDVTFLSKDIPKDFIEFMINTIREQIHVQSHVPDFTSSRFTGIMSGVAIKRLLFDFENVCSSAESEFDIGLYKRLTLISNIITLTKQFKGDPNSIDIIHKRNVPLDETDEMNVAILMRNVGLSMETILEQLPRDMVPNIKIELERQVAQKAEQQANEVARLKAASNGDIEPSPGKDTTWAK